MKKPGQITTLVPWFGTNRSLAENVGRALDGCSWVGVPFAGGMSELRHITARTIIASDLHEHLINLANIVAGEPSDFGRFLRRLRRLPLSKRVLDEAQKICRFADRNPDGVGESGGMFSCWQSDGWYREWAAAYFVSSWMGRNGTAGTDGEFNSGLSVRWDAGGGDSALRFRNAVEGLREWRKVFVRCTFVVMDVFDFLAKVKDADGHGVYCDPPFIEVGDGYKHKFSRLNHCQLAEQLAAYEKTRVVCRFYDHPLIRELYPETEWTWHHLAGGKTQTNAKAPEVLLVRNAG